MGNTRPIQRVVDEGGWERGRPAVYSRDNATSTYGSVTSIVDPRYSLCRIFVFEIYVWYNWNMHRKTGKNLTALCKRGIRKSYSY